MDYNTSIEKAEDEILALPTRAMSCTARHAIAFTVNGKRMPSAQLHSEDKTIQPIDLEKVKSISVIHDIDGKKDKIGSTVRRHYIQWHDSYFLVFDLKCAGQMAPVFSILACLWMDPAEPRVEVVGPRLGQSSLQSKRRFPTLWIAFGPCAVLSFSIATSPKPRFRRVLRESFTTHGR